MLEVCENWSWTGTYDRGGDDGVVVLSGVYVCMLTVLFIQVEATAEITSQKYTKIVSLAEELNKALEEQERKEKNGEISDAESLESIRDKNKELVKAILESSKEPGDSLLSKEEKEESPSA
jgi:dsDNA-binding SOS-regulon protein